MTTGEIRLTREPKHVGPVGFLELFFDLAYVFALTRLSVELIERLDWIGGVHTLVLLGALWTIWSGTAWMTGRFDPNRPVIQLVVLARMLGTLVMSVAVPGAFQERAPLFAGAYVAAQLIRTVFFLYALRGPALRTARIRTLLWAAGSAIPWLLGAAVDGPLRTVVWALGLTLDYTITRVGYPLPGHGRIQLADLPLAGEYASERYRQFIIVTLGDMILVTAAAYAEDTIKAGDSLAFGIAFATTVLMWRIYIFRAGELLATAISSARHPARIGVLASDAHLIMIAGILVTTVGDEVALAHPYGHLRPSWLLVILGGPALFLAGRALFEYVVFAYVSWSRRIGLVLLAAAAPLLTAGPPVLASGAVSLLLAGIGVANILSWRSYPREPRAPGRQGS